MSVTVVPLSQGLVALIDEIGSERILKHQWRAICTGRKFYVVADIDGKMVYLHRFVMGADDNSPWVDHKNGLTADCRRDNLRFCSPTENAQNAITKQSNRSGVKGVTFHTGSGLYQARIRVDGKRLSLGYYPTAAEAGVAYATAAHRHFGEFANVG